MSTITSQGTSVSFGGSPIGKLLGVSGSFASPQKEIRALAPNLAGDTGQYLSIYEETTCEQSVELECLAETFSLATVGTKGALSVTGSGWSLSFPAAICENMKVTAKVGDLVRLTYAFKRSYV